mgnify:FL=1
MANHLVNTLYGNVAGLRLMGAAAVELCYIAAGRFEARIEALLVHGISLQEQSFCKMPEV